MALSQIEVFIKVIENRSFTKAGEELHMSQSAVSHSIALMEEELGLPLIIRDKKQGVMVSDFGARVLIAARNILKEVSQIKQAAAMEKGLDIGTIRIGSFPSATARLLPKIISRFKKQYSGIDILLFDGDNQEVSEWLSNGVIDISFTAKLEKSNNIIPLTKDKIFAVLPKNHPLLELQSIPISEFSDIPFIMPKSGCEPLIMGIFNSEGLSPSVQKFILMSQQLFGLGENL
ncbi:LysR family transcriptional regulator [Clostridium pasteurianum]|uniref:Transcriptional regulator n=1 Tax=Clostridium pasteurianum BC1 TaxID=86416 RepID=R4K8P3_CLOPA|nr:LysR family transcriptional regulator [Clostridium pasteurianum]AGK99527.1 transcriptional regulator [Clostridium pasteurianum BC1]